MTEQTPTPPLAQPLPVEPAPVLVDLTTENADVRLAALVSAYPGLKAEADAAKERLDAAVAGIKSLTTAMATQLVEGQRFEIRGASIRLGLRHQVTRRFNTKRFQKDNPGAYESYRDASGSWVLEPIKGGE